MRVLVLCMSCLCLWLGKLSVMVSADYVVQVRVVSFSHPSNRRSDRQCCDPGNGGGCSGGERCDTFFIYCLRPRFTTAGGCPSFEPGFFARSTNIVDGADIDFSQPTVLGLPNPFNLTGISTAWEGAQLYVRVLDDDDSSPSDIIETYPLDLILSVESTITFTLTRSSSFRPVMPVEITLLCAPFYSGSSCEILDHCEFNAVTCSGRGMCVNEMDSFTCTCILPYFGTNCERENFCFGRNCNGRGTCTNGIDSHICACEPGYTGDDCEVDIDECLLMKTVCSGHGNCSDGIASFTCSCDPGYTGDICETNIDDCVNVNCSGQGNCTDRVNGFDCDCFPGYTDANCEIDINECDGIVCSGSGRCVDMVNMFRCDCEPGFTGTYCETNIDDCVNGNCSGNGVCVDGVNSFSCDCVSGFTGSLCNTEEFRAGPGGLIGGVVAGLLVLMLVILLLSAAVVVCVRRAQGKTIQDTHLQADTTSYTPGDNPVYGIPENNIHRKNTITSETAEFDNPIYGSHESVNDAELDNPIYGDADFEDVPYQLAPAAPDYETPVVPVYGNVQNRVMNNFNVHS